MRRMMMIAACCAALITPAAANDRPQSGQQPATSRPPPDPLPTDGFRLTGQCRVGLRPDRTVVAGGMSARSLLPTEAGAQLDQQLAALQRYVDAQGGSVVLQERIRAISDESSDRHAVRGLDEQPFLLVQRLEASFPIGADIDAILEALLQLGLDRYGSDTGVRSYAGQTQIVVRYRFSGLAEQLAAARADCKRSALRDWCAEGDAATAQAWCATQGAERRFVTERLTWQSQPVVNESGHVAPLTIAYPEPPGNQRIELMGDIELTLDGSITMRAASP